MMSYLPTRWSGTGSKWFQLCRVRVWESHWVGGVLDRSMDISPIHCTLQRFSKTVYPSDTHTLFLGPYPKPH
jgi:hypothetical protein